MLVDENLYNALITVGLLGYIVYILFFRSVSADLRNLISSVVNNRVGKVLVILGITMCALPNKFKVCGPKIGILLFIAYFLTISQMEQENFDVVPYRPGDKALALGIPDPIPQTHMNEKIKGVTGPTANSGVSRALDMN
jgi:hypothetical protein